MFKGVKNLQKDLMNKEMRRYMHQEGRLVLFYLLILFSLYIEQNFNY